MSERLPTATDATTVADPNPRSHAGLPRSTRMDSVPPIYFAIFGLTPRSLAPPAGHVQGRAPMAPELPVRPQRQAPADLGV